MLNWDINRGYLNRTEPIGLLVWRSNYQDLMKGECDVEANGMLQAGVSGKRLARGIQT